MRTKAKAKFRRVFVQNYVVLRRQTVRKSWISQPSASSNLCLALAVLALSLLPARAAPNVLELSTYPGRLSDPLLRRYNRPTDKGDRHRVCNRMTLRSPLCSQPAMRLG